jgi:hypothetical protein
MVESAHGRERLMAKITFHESASPGEGDIIRVRRDGLPFGRIYRSGGVYMYYKAGRQTLAGPDLENAHLELLKVAVKARYGRRRLMGLPWIIVTVAAAARARQLESLGGGC